jgi:NhaP-type Na+/H+ or K+/H+ antiporter
MHDHILIILTGIGLLSIVCQWFAWWVKLPAILFLLIVGIIAGPVTGWLHPDEIFGDLLFPMVSLSVAIILFEGSLTLRFDEIRGLTQVVRRMVTVGALVTWSLISVLTHWILNFDWTLAFLFGAVVVVTGPTVITPMLRTVRPNSRIANVLRWEGIVIDPIGAILAVLVFEFIISNQTGGGAIGHTLIAFGQTLLAGIVAGVLGGYSLGIILRNHWLPEYLHNVAALTLVFGVFTVSNVAQEESGLLAVTIMGMILANMKRVQVDNILDFKESLSILLISGLFIILAARTEIDQLSELGWSALILFVAIQFLVRPAKIIVSTWGSSLTWQEKALLSWIAPRGIVAAAVAALFALKLQQQGYAQADLLVPLTFMVIIGTVVLQSATARPIANWLGVSEPEAKGYLIIGANSLARAIAKVLDEKGYRTLLVDSSWNNIRTASMDGFKTYYGNPVSEHADRHLDLIGIGHLMALSDRSELNALATMRYRSEFGAGNLYVISPSRNEDSTDKRKFSMPKSTHILFGEGADYHHLSDMMEKGAEIRSTNITEKFDMAEYNTKYFGRSVPLFAINPKGRLYPFVVDKELEPKPGWTIISLASPADDTEKVENQNHNGAGLEALNDLASDPNG